MSFTLKDIGAVVAKREAEEPYECDYDLALDRGFNQGIDDQANIKLEFTGREKLAQVLGEWSVGKGIFKFSKYDIADAILKDMNANPSYYIGEIKG